MTELEMYELWCTLRLWANYNQLNQTIEKNWLSNSFNSHILDLLDKEEIKYRSEKRLLGYRNKGKRRLAGNANQPIIINIDDVANLIAALGPAAHNQRNNNTAFPDAVHQFVHLHILADMERMVGKSMQQCRGDVQFQTIRHDLSLLSFLYQS